MTYSPPTVVHLRERVRSERAVDDLEALLKQLLWHHESQAKPNTPACTRKYHAEVAGKLRRHVFGEIR